MALPLLPPPNEFLELKPEEPVEITVRSWKLGMATIKPRYAGAPPEKTVRALRCWVPPETKPLGPDYWDITQGTLIYTLMGYLEKPDFTKYRYRITKYGVPPKARFTVEPIPL